MSAAEDGLVDALNAIQASRTALENNDPQLALLHLVFANRYHATALTAHSMSLAGPLRNADEVNEKLRALQAAFLAAMRPAHAPAGIVVEMVAEGLRPILRELAAPGADPDAVVAARARNCAAILLGAFDIRSAR